MLPFVHQNGSSFFIMSSDSVVGYFNMYVTQVGVRKDRAVRIWAGLWHAGVGVGVCS